VSSAFSISSRSDNSASSLLVRTAGSVPDPPGPGNPDLPCNRGGCYRVVTGNHLHPDARTHAGRNRGRGFRPRGVHHCLQADKDEPLRRVLRAQVVSAGRQLGAGKGENPQAFCRRRVRLTHDSRRVQGGFSVRAESRPTAAEDAFHGPLEVHHPRLLRTLVLEGSQVLAL
jgi:hypothetical protein